jgi:hypothetical protein
MDIVRKKSFKRRGNNWLCQVKGGTQGWGLLLGHFYTTLNLQVGREYVITWLL